MVVYCPTVSHLVEAIQPRAPVCLVQLNIYQLVVQGEQINLGQLPPLPCCMLTWLAPTELCLCSTEDRVCSFCSHSIHPLASGGTFCTVWGVGGRGLVHEDIQDLRLLLTHTNLFWHSLGTLDSDYVL